VIYANGNVPDRVLERHLRDKHDKGASWIGSHGDDLRTDHRSEHQVSYTDHDLDGGLED
jgi:hypothetical protein